jgi:hypothetical protein
VAESSFVPASSAVTPAVTPTQLLGEIARLVEQVSVPAARGLQDVLPAASLLDEVTDDERWLWSLVVEAERVAAAVPAGPDPQQLATVEERYAQACLLEQRVATRIRAAEAALVRLSSWLRPSHRAAVARHLREDRGAAVGAAVTRGRIEEVRHRLRAMATHRAEYLSKHHTTLSAGQNARAELTRLLDDLIDGYARLPEPPAWFRYGLEFPPEPGTHRQWLIAAREAVQERRRFSWEAPS